MVGASIDQIVQETVQSHEGYAIALRYRDLHAFGALASPFLFLLCCEPRRANDDQVFQNFSYFQNLHMVAEVNVGHHDPPSRSEEHTSELQSLMRNSYAVFCFK